MAFFKKTYNSIKKLLKNPYVCICCLLILASLGMMLYQNIDKFTNTNFMSSSKRQLVLFYSPDCGYCKQVLPIWSKFEMDFNGRKNTVISKINGYSYPDLCKRYGIEGFPTILFIKDGSIVAKYSGDRTYNSFVEFLNSMGAN